MIFSGGYRITQIFGARPDYYDDFGLKGHEGLDVAPKTSDWNVCAVADGVVVKDEDSPRSGAYGIYLTIWHPKLKKATQYCHLEFNSVNINDQIKAGQSVGKMGSTGNSTGPHLHLNVYDVDDNGVRLNKNNGYNGGIDPLPFINKLEAEGGSMPVTGGTVNITNAKFSELVQKATQWDTVADMLFIDKMDQGGGKKVVELFESKTKTNEEAFQAIDRLQKEVERLKNLPPQVVEKEVIKEVIKEVPVNVGAEPQTLGEFVSITARYLARVWEKIKNK